MPSNYYKAMSEIKASDELKARIKVSMEKELKQKNKKQRTAIFAKINKTIAAITATTTALLCGGIAFATIVGSARNYDGIVFSDEYEEYEEVLENPPYLESNGNIITLQSTVADSGFIILKFNVKLNEKHSKIAEEKGGLYYVSFNDAQRELGEPMLGGSNRNIIIDGEKYWTSAPRQTVKDIIKYKEYEVYQLWFLATELENKTTFKFTLNDVAIVANGQTIDFDGNFELELSKEKTSQNTKIIQGTDESISYKKLKKSIKEVKVTPLQNIVEISDIQENVSIKNLCYVYDPYYIGDTEYIVTDQDGNAIASFQARKKCKITYEDGITEEGNYDLMYSNQNFKNATIENTEYLAIEKSKEIKKIKIQALYRKDNSNSQILTKIGEFEINLETKEIKTIQDKEQKTEKMFKGVEGFNFLYPLEFNLVNEDETYFEDNDHNGIMLKCYSNQLNEEISLKDWIEDEKELTNANGEKYRNLIKEEEVTTKKGVEGYKLEFTTVDNAYQVIFFAEKYNNLYNLTFTIKDKTKYDDYTKVLNKIFDTLELQ